MTDAPSQRSHHWFLFFLGVIGVGIVAYLTYTGLLLFREYRREYQRTLQLESTTADNENATSVNDASGTVAEEEGGEDGQDALVVDRTEPLPTITNGWSTVAGQQRVRGTVIAVTGSTLRIIIDDAKSYPEADVQYTSKTTTENVDTTAFDAQGQPVRTSTAATALTTGDVIEITTTEPIAADATIVTAATITRYQ